MRTSFCGLALCHILATYIPAGSHPEVLGECEGQKGCVKTPQSMSTPNPTLGCREVPVGGGSGTPGSSAALWGYRVRFLPDPELPRVRLVGLAPQGRPQSGGCSPSLPNFSPALRR